MPECQGLTGMRVVVMAVIVTMHMDVFHFVMLVLMCVLVSHQQIDGKPHDSKGQDLNGQQRFFEKNRREDDAEKWCAGKNHLRARRS